MFRHLEHIYDPRERWLVGLADLGLAAATWPGRALARPATREIRRILLLRIERIGDLLMTLGAIESVRATWPSARIDLVVGSWNADLARRLPAVDRVETLDAPWLARGPGGASAGALIARVREWRSRGYDLAINLEGDIRTNLMIGASGAPTRVGFAMAGGGAALTDVASFDPRRHTDDNTREAVRHAARALGATIVEPAPAWPRIVVSPDAQQRADALLAGGGRPATPLIGLHASGGREIKQWHPDRFGTAVAGIARAIGGRVVLTGTRDDRPLVDAARAAMPLDVDLLDLSGPLDLLTLAAVLSRLDLYVTGDTGPMHLAAAMGTPVVAVFGVSSPERYAPLAPHRRLVRIDIPCSPCNRVRLPPERCRGHVPDCLEGITAAMVEQAGLDLLNEVRDATTPRRSGVGA